MKNLIGAAVLSALASFVTPGIAAAGTIENACNRSDRQAANRALCGCIQDVADLTLSGTDQRMAASFFSGPHTAQLIRQSDCTSHESFWQRYKNFGQTAEVYCAG